MAAGASLPPILSLVPTRMFLVPQELFVSAGINEHITMSRAGDLNYFRSQALDKVSVVRHEHERAAVVDQGVEQHFFRVEIEMVRRFVQQEDIRRTQQHAGDGQARALSA